MLKILLKALVVNLVIALLSPLLAVMISVSLSTSVCFFFFVGSVCDLYTGNKNVYLFSVDVSLKPKPLLRRIQ